MAAYIINKLKEEPDFITHTPQYVDGFTCWTYTKMIVNFFSCGREIVKGLNPERCYNGDEYHINMEDFRALSEVMPAQIGLRKKGESANSYGERTLTGLAYLMADPTFFLYLDYCNKEGKVIRERLVWNGTKQYKHITSKNQQYLKERALHPKY